jgi:NAD+ diphosphatase
MAFRLFDMPDNEPSRFVGFAGNRLDRQSEKRDEDSLAVAIADPRALVLLMGGGRLVLDLAGAAARAGHSVGEAMALGANLAEAILLGYEDGRPVVAAPLPPLDAELPHPYKAVDYRSVYTQGLLGREELGALAQGAAMLAWSANHRFCGRCGGATTTRAGGYRRLCTQCGAEHFPRTDPVAIMLAVHGDECLLARGRHFAPGMYSCLAGFIEPGETIEDAVRRETLEESGLSIGRVAYHASQPWPFPYSLMIGCHAEALSRDLSLDESELEAGRWFAREEVRAMVEGRHPDGLIIPPPAAIASHLIQSWIEAG